MARRGHAWDAGQALRAKMEEDWDAGFLLTSWLLALGKRKDGEEKERIMGRGLIRSWKAISSHNSFP